MTKTFLLGASTIALLLTGHLAMQAQPSASSPTQPNPQVSPGSTKPNPQVSPSPNKPGNSTKPANPTQPSPAKPTPSTPASNEISSEELSRFINVVQQVGLLTRTAEGKAQQALQEEGLSEDRFREIYQAQKNPSVKPSKPIQASEQASYNRIVARIGTIAKENETQVEQVLRSQKMETERFQQIITAIQNNPSLREEVRKRLRPAPAPNP